MHLQSNAQLRLESGHIRLFFNKPGLSTKTIRVMQLLAVFLLAAVLQVSAIGTAQTVTINVKSRPLEEIFSAIKSQTGYAVFYRKNDLRKAKPVSATLNNMELNQALQIILANQPLQFELKRNTVFISEKPSQKQSVHDHLVIVPAPPISGKVVGPDGQPLAGANVIIKGSNRGTTSKADGSFSIDAKDGELLIISSIGYGDRQIRIGYGDIGIITLARAESKLDEVQIVAYGTTKKKYLTSNIGSISGEEIAKQPVSNPLLAMQGRVPGLFIRQTSGNTAGNVSTLIQGRNSINNGTEPFYVIDGIPFSPNMVGNTLAGFNFPSVVGGGGSGSAFNFINPNDIESIEILKDADATAIYGSRAANGAILITTKRGKAGATKVTLNLQSGMGKVARRAKLMNTEEYLQLRKEAFTNDELPIPTPADDPDYSNFDLTIWNQNKNHDWQEELVGGTANFSNIQTSVSGGSNNTQFLLGANYNKQTSVYPTNLSDRKYSLHFNIAHSSDNKKFNFSFSTNYLQSNNSLPQEDLMNRALTLAPNAPDLYNSDGSINWAPYPNDPNQFSFGDNPAALLMNKYSGATDNLLANAMVSYTLMKGLQLKSTFGYNLLRADETLISPIAALNPMITNRQALSDFINKSTKSYIIEPQLQFTREISWGDLGFLLGATFQQNQDKVTGYRASGFANDEQLSNISAATSITSLNSDEQRLYKYNAVFARLNYRLQDKYVVNLNARRDGSSRFGTNNKLHNFYSAGIAWLFADEQWLTMLRPIVSSGKLRVNYGTVGNDQLADYAYESLLQNAPYGIPYQNLVSTRPFRHSNPDLQWEETKKLNIGVDLGFLTEKISLSANYFLNRSSNQLIIYQLPAMTGFRDVYANFPATIQNSGLELLLNTSPLKRNQFGWQISINATIPRSKLVSFKDFEKSTYASSYIIGKPVNIIRIFDFAGVDPNTGEYTFRTSTGEITSFVDFEKDLTGIANTNPKWYGGFSNTILLKNFTIDFLFQYVNQIAENERFLLGVGGSNVNAPRYVYENRWKDKGQITEVGRVSTMWQVPVSYAAYSNAKYSDASYLRLKNASISYNLANSITKKINIREVRLYVQGQNLLTFTNYRGIDPESAIYASLPPLRMYTAGLQVTF